MSKTKPTAPTTEAAAKLAPQPRVYLTNNQLMALFGISQMTAYLWRTRTSANRPKTIPTVKPKKGESARKIKYDVDSVMAWAKKMGVTPAITVPKAIELAPEKTTGPRSRVKVPA